ncbi:MAG: thiol peroxidase [Deltaproteobacteria bacterium]|nr:thiol peroxidase [Deltaproteobacteria bacterium]
MEDINEIITLQGNPVTLAGSIPDVGNVAPDCELVANDLSMVRLSRYRGKVCILTTLSSIDTAVCAAETQRFDTEAAWLGADVQILAISVDLPFALRRWCGAKGVSRLTTLSDYRETALGLAFGVLIKEFRLLARTVFVLDREGIIRYREIVSEVTDEPDYKKALDAARALV